MLLFLRNQDGKSKSKTKMCATTFTDPAQLTTLLIKEGKKKEGQRKKKRWKEGWEKEEREGGEEEEEREKETPQTAGWQ